MPQAIYTAAKGLYESTDSGSGFSISDAPIILGTQEVELKQIVYGLDFTGVTTVDDQESSENAADQTTAYQNQTFVLYDATGTAVTFEFNHDAAGTWVVEANAGAGDATIAIADTDTAEDIAIAAASAISGYNSGNTFAVKRSTADLTIYVKTPGAISAAATAIVEAQSILDTIATGDTTPTFAIDQSGAVSRVASYISADRGNNKPFPTANQIHGAGLSVVTLESDNADAAIEVAFANGSDVGQEKYIYNAASTGPVVLTGLFQKTTDNSGTSISIAAGAAEWLIWNGSQWYLALSNATMS